MPTIEELEHRVSRLETLFEEVIKDRLTYISQRLDQLYEKTEKDKSDLYAKTEKDKSELLEKMTNIYADLYAKTEKDKSDLYAKTEKDKRVLVQWMVGLFAGFSTLIITAMWAIISFAVK
ncbi:MAG: hypothetical protein AB1478_11140 [Nitrospirota bacterium]